MSEEHVQAVCRQILEEVNKLNDMQKFFIKTFFFGQQFGNIFVCTSYSHSVHINCI